jgi:2-oxoglutarate dehydrogenase E1 component
MSPTMRAAPRGNAPTGRLPAMANWSPRSTANWGVDEKAAAKAVGEKLKKNAQAAGVEVSTEQVQQATRDSVRAIMMIRAYRMRGHLAADLDPLDLKEPEDHPELDPRSYGWTEEDFSRKIFLDKVLGLDFATIPKCSRS